jgi:hypothetical protein
MFSFTWNEKRERVKDYPFSGKRVDGCVNSSVNPLISPILNIVMVIIPKNNLKKSLDFSWCSCYNNNIIEIKE